MQKKYCLFLIFFMLFDANTSHARHSEKDIRTKIREHLNKISSCPASDYFLLANENKKLLAYLTDICSHEPASLYMNLSGLSENFYVVNADDGKMRTYYWNTHIDKTVYDVMVQFQSGDSTGVWIWNDAYSKNRADVSLGISTPSKITTIQTSDSRTVYLVTSDARIGQGNLIENIEAYLIAGNVLESIPFFQTARGIKSLISYIYDPTFHNNYDVQSSIHFSKDKQKLYIPLVIDGIVKRNYLVYTFNGNNYVFDKNAK